MQKLGKNPPLPQRKLLETKKLCTIAPFNKVTHFILKNRYYIKIKKEILKKLKCIAPNQLIIF